MKTKYEIVQKLLEEQKVTAEEAMILLMSGENQVHYIPYTPTYPIYPLAPFYPTLPSWPIITYGAPINCNYQGAVVTIN